MAALPSALAASLRRRMTAAAARGPAAPLRRALHASSRPAVSVVGAPLSYGQPKAGADLGPTMLRQAGLLEAIAKTGCAVEDRGDLQLAAAAAEAEAAAADDPNALNSQAVGAACRLISQAVHDELQAGRFPLTLGGDHAIGIGTLSGVLRARPEASVVWVDAHADLNTPEASGSKNLHGMSLAFLVEGILQAHRVAGFEWMEGGPRVGDSRVVLIGLRELDEFERQLLRRSGARAFTMQDIDRYGIGKVMEMAHDHLDRVNRGGPVHVSVDIDSVDPFLAPATGTLVRGGLTYRESNYICEALAENADLCSMDLVEVNPTLDPAGAKSTADIGVQMVCSALGQRIL